MNTTRTYQYDTLGNLIREEQDGCVEYKYNGAHLDESTKCGTIPNSIGTSYWEYTYDNRGNLVSRDKYTRTTSGMAWQNEAAYTYDETNRMVSGKNEQGEYSIYTYNGLGMRVGRELIMKDNTHGYTDFHDLTPSVDTGIDKPEVVKESYVIDYTSATFDPLTMDEDGGFSYRYVYGLNTLSVKITSEGTNWWGQHVTTDILKDYYHQDRLGSTTNLTDKFGRVVGRADYDEWGQVTYKEALSITSSYRRIWPQLSYTGHDYDDVLDLYYAKARFYSADDKRFVSMDPIKGEIVNPLSLVPYVYCVNNPLRWVDPLGLIPGRASMVQTMVSDGGSGSRGNVKTPEVARQRIATPRPKHIETTPSKPTTRQNNTPVPSKGYQEQLQCQSEYGSIQTFMIMGLANATDWFERTINNAFNAILEIGKNVGETEAGYVKKTWDSLRNGDWGGFANSLVNSVTFGGWNAAMDGMNRRYAEYKENPSIYTSLNRLSFGLVETFGRVFSPESYGIEANSVEHWEAFYGALLTEVVVLKTVKVTSNSIERVTTDPHSPAGLSNIANSKENVIMSQAAMAELEDLDPYAIVQELLENKTITEDALRSIIPDGVENTFRPSARIAEGYKYDFVINGVPVQVKWHSPDLGAPIGGYSNSMWTAQIKIGKKLLGCDGVFYSNPNNLTHIPFTGGE